MVNFMAYLMVCLMLGVLYDVLDSMLGAQYDVPLPVFHLSNPRLLHLFPNLDLSLTNDRFFLKHQRHLTQNCPF